MRRLGLELAIAARNGTACMTDELVDGVSVKAMAARERTHPMTPGVVRCEAWIAEAEIPDPSAEHLGAVTAAAAETVWRKGRKQRALLDRLHELEEAGLDERRMQRDRPL